MIAPDSLTREELIKLSKSVSYKGNPAHKLNPGDYHLTPPASPRQGKTLCDQKRPINLADAMELIRTGVRRAMISSQTRGDWPQNIWSVNEHNEVFEAQLENRETGEYHGYPISSEDDFGHLIASEWLKRAKIDQD